MTRFRLAVLIALGIFLATLPAVAQADPDPPSRVARLNYLSGDVSFQPGGVDDWTAAELNRPLTTADRLWTDRDSKAELHIGNAALRLGPETSFTLANLDDHSVQIQLAQGTLNLRVRALPEDESYEVDTPNLSFILLHPGEYRVDVDSEGQTSVVTVRSGSGELAGAGQRITLRADQQAHLSAGENAASEIKDAPGRDRFDEWCLSRTRGEDAVKSARYVSPEVTGYEDLDVHGDWREESGYGAVWVPRGVPVDWAPYSYGHWAWVFPWGWTWIDDSPWGFAPFHYGRWVHLRYGWGWIPGPRVVRPVYAPALVAWIGGTNWAVGVSTGRPVGWFPLGPREVYVPAYRASHTYVTNVNVTNTTIKIVNINDTHITRVYVNQHVRGAVTAVPEDAFINSHSVHRAVVHVNEKELRRVEVVAAVPVAPAPRSLLGREGAPGRRPPERVLVRPVVSRTAAPRPVPFEAQRQSVAKDGTIRPVRTREFPEMRRPQTNSPDQPGAPANSRDRDRLPERRADRDRAEPENRGGPRNDARPISSRPGVNVPRPGKDEATPRRERDEVSRSPEEHDKSGAPNRVVPRPPEKDADRKTPEPERREVPRPQERVSDQPKPSAPRAIASPGERDGASRSPEEHDKSGAPGRAVPRPPEKDADRKTPEPERREVPRPQQERVSDQPKPSAPREIPASVKDSPGWRTSEPAVRDVPRPRQGRVSEQPKPAAPPAITSPGQESLGSRTPERAVREVPRPPQERVSERPQPSAPRAVTPPVQERSGPRAFEPAVREPSRPQQGNGARNQGSESRQPHADTSRPASNAPKANPTPNQHQAAPQKQEDKSKSKPDKDGRS